PCSGYLPRAPDVVPEKTPPTVWLTPTSEPKLNSDGSRDAQRSFRDSQLSSASWNRLPVGQPTPR
ncbi:MAG: hypothetical protein AAGC97_14225, partial [Planctomycetota bacterium]